MLDRPAGTQWRDLEIRHHVDLYALRELCGMLAGPPLTGFLGTDIDAISTQILGALVTPSLIADLIDLIPKDPEPGPC